jgi:hypothetical protein
MRPTVSLRVAVATLFTAVVLTSVIATAENGRDFAGHYCLTNAVEKGNQVDLTLGVWLFNFSGADLKGAEVTVRGQHPGPVLGSFAPIMLWRSGRDVVLRQQLTIPREEFRHWSERMQPNVFVSYHDEDGQPHQRWAQLSRRPVLPESAPEASQ